MKLNDKVTCNDQGLNSIRNFIQLPWPTAWIYFKIEIDCKCLVIILMSRIWSDSIGFCQCIKVYLNNASTFLLKKNTEFVFFIYKNLYWGKEQQTEKPLTKNVTINIVSCCTHEGICYLKPRNKRGMQLFETKNISIFFNLFVFFYSFFQFFTLFSNNN